MLTEILIVQAFGRRGIIYLLYALNWLRTAILYGAAMKTRYILQSIFLWSAKLGVNWVIVIWNVRQAIPLGLPWSSWTSSVVSWWIFFATAVRWWWVTAFIWLLDWVTTDYLFDVSLDPCFFQLLFCHLKRRTHIGQSCWWTLAISVDLLWKILRRLSVGQHWAEAEATVMFQHLLYFVIVVISIWFMYFLTISWKMMSFTVFLFALLTFVLGLISMLTAAQYILITIGAIKCLIIRLLKLAWIS